jgi:DNA-binding winged helix-turn-helix (wHTH) protein/TolB-like protein
MLDGMRLHFADFVFDSESGELWREGAVMPLQPQPAKVLALLLLRPGRVVTREEIQLHVWGSDTHVDFEQGLNWCVRRIREVLGDSPVAGRFIQTIPRRGYRFLAEVKECAPIAEGERPASWWRSRKVAMAATFLVLACVSCGWLLGRSSGRRVTVLVLPFDNLNGSQTGTQVEDMAWKELISELAVMNPKRLSVIDPLTARKFKNTNECIIKIGNQLGADYVLLGDVEPSATTVKVDAQLFKVSTNRQVWAAQRQYARNGEFSTIWHEMGSEIGAEVQQRAVAKN